MANTIEKASCVWTRCADALPDSDTTVLIHNPRWLGSHVWMGYHDGDGWLAVEGCRLDCPADADDDAAEPTHWARFPEPPTEEAI